MPGPAGAALLWFGSWKNGQMHDVPEWIKRNEATYPRMRDANGEPVDVLSPQPTCRPMRARSLR
ncbi:hypothetical protein DXO170_04475 [Xanthomonas oryzae pv. oryzae]|uniref:Uncharacterized protein n=2 Tax=Xanthomonas oryzae pv. oryzae TaxID=64187 RepID=Q5GY38_XANOR|nr:conserved hypothetical protein [Xanthomonas oryzae pv. oryzae KACC 10331]AOS03225.1 hypothetical protein ATY42_15280 [Xanthomonas oryzae pv. oryzae]AOS19865.1 hypothetical protein ATY46_15570 [Xanthomonas oryzae pv. oryzae]AOS24024.1 hypothetical protein ATY47_15510 [Xanthomonas oryzae pv. oryzae]AOS28180.1 hypothetical protein ATY48_15420 [Xanthomonas oryzae pv. oryzae]